MNIFPKHIEAILNKEGALRLGIFGGTFDPVHNAHIGCAKSGAINANLDALVFMPAYVNPFKQNNQKFSGILKLANPQQRIRMCELACEVLQDKVPKCEFGVSAWEIEQGNRVEMDANQRPSYTIKTLEVIRKQYPLVNLYFIVGTDAALSLPQWYKAEELAQLATFLEVERAGVLVNQNSRKSVKDAGFDLLTVEGPGIDLFSKDVRKALSQGESITNMVPPSIARFISEEQLYVSNERIPQ